MLTRWFALLLAAPAVPAAAQGVEERAKLEAVAERGRLIFELDRAAWVATDDLREKWPGFERDGVKGYVVEREEDGPVVTFFGEQDGRSVAMYLAKVSAGGVVSGRVLTAAERSPLTDAQRRMAEVRRIDLDLGYHPCTEAQFNTAIIPPASAADPIDMYLLTPQMDNEVFPFGGHFLVTVGPDGKVLKHRRFTNTCLNMPDDPEAIGLGITHLLDPHPTEIHVFVSLGARKPIYVGTQDPERVWVVEGDKIRLIQGR